MLNDKTIRATFIISLAGHLFLLGMPGFNLPSFQLEKPEEIMVRIEIEKPPLLPKIDIMGEEKKLKETEEEPEQPKPELQPQSEEIVMEEFPKEPIEEKFEVIDFANEAVLRYQDMVKQEIESCRRYPNWAKRQGIEGVSYLVFTLLSNGMVQDIKLIKSSGFDILDEEAISTVKRASPFHPIPAKFNCSNLTMEVALVFKLE